MQAAPGYPGTPVPPLDARPRIGEWLSEAFTLFGREWLTWCLITLIYTLALALPISLLSGALVGGMFALIAAVDSAGRGGGPTTISILAIGLGTLAIIIVALGLNAFLYAGMTRAAIRQLRGEKISVADLFSAGDVLMPAMIVDLLRGLGAGLGVLLCVIPGLIATTLWMYAHPLAVERRLTPGEALRLSAQTLKPHLLMYFLWLILLFVVASAGSAVAIGSLVTIPIAHIALVVSYRDIFGISGAVPTVTPGIAGQPVSGYGTHPSPYAPPPPPGP